jgi:hypothetical protein
MTVRPTPFMPGWISLTVIVGMFAHTGSAQKRPIAANRVKSMGRILMWLASEGCFESLGIKTLNILVSHANDRAAFIRVYVL